MSSTKKKTGRSYLATSESNKFQLLLIAAEYPVGGTLELGDYAICFSFTEIDVQKIAACNAR